ncbi:MAG: hypothetical protein IKJ26_10375 [Clostridia bacterium]|nr:hypothetical protein [Clostridia bacterium]
MPKRPFLRMLLRLICFVLILTALVFVLDIALFDSSTVTPVWQAVRDGSTDPVDVLFVGNSHTYASLNDSVMRQALDKNVQILRCSSANGGIAAAMLEAYLHYNVPKLIVLECNPFMVDNYATMRGDLRGIVYQSFDGIPGYWQKAKALSAVMDAENVPAGMFQLFRPTGMWNRWQQTAPAAPGYEPYHSFTFQYDFHAADLEDYYRIPDDSSSQSDLLPANQQALNRIIALSEEQDFELWLIVAPIAHYAEEYRQAMQQLYAISQNCDRITLFDNSMEQLEAIGLTARDFYDAGHLCRRGSEKYTQHMIGLLASHYGIQPDYSHILAYRTEDTVLCEDGLQLHMECYGDALYQFLYPDANEKNYETNWSPENTITLPADILPETVTVRMKLASDPEGETLSYAFMAEEE